MKHKQLKQLVPDGICPHCFGKIRLLYSVRSPTFGGRRCRTYVCDTCHIEVPFWSPSFRIEKGEAEVAYPE